MQLQYILLPAIFAMCGHASSRGRRATSSNASGSRVVYYNGTAYAIQAPKTGAAPAQTSTSAPAAQTSASAAPAQTSASAAPAQTSASAPAAQTSASAATTAAQSQTTQAGQAASTSATASQSASSAPAQSTQTSQPTSGSSAGGGGGSGGALVPTKDEFVKAVTSSGYQTPTDAQYNSFSKNIDSATFSSKREVAMFLAEILWESAGLTAKSEIGCESGGCTQYNQAGDPPGKQYYGRGYIQLSWSYNYKAASQGIFNNTSLYDDPDQVATNEDIAWQVSFWYWRTNVHPDSGVQAGQFGSATNKINGALECGANSSSGKAQNRFNIYTKVLPAFGINETPNSAGC